MGLKRRHSRGKGFWSETLGVLGHSDGLLLGLVDDSLWSGEGLGGL